MPKKLTSADTSILEAEHLETPGVIPNLYLL